jgi:hypothetical protein
MMQAHVQMHPQDRNRTYGTLEAFHEFLDQFVPPTEAFDPLGAWKQSYQIQLFGEMVGSVGFLELERRPAPQGFALTVATEFTSDNGRQEETAKLLSAADKFGSLRSIQAESVTSDVAGAPIPSLKIALSGQVRDGSIEWTRAGRKRTARAAAPVVSNWALFDAVQRLKPDGEQPLAFTLVDDGDVVKPGQRVTYAGKTQVKVAGGAGLSLDCWEQTGYGIIPIHYWVDAQHRLLFAIAGQKAFLFDPGARNKPGEIRVKGRKRS